MSGVKFESNAISVKKTLLGIGKGWVRDATFQLQRDSLTRTPVDQGGLRASQTVDFEEQAAGRNAKGQFTQGQYVGIVGYTSEYAPYVHEIPDAELSPEVRATRAAGGTGSNFLMGALEDNRSQLIKDYETRLRSGRGSD
jgi:hypothetical protein